MLHLLVALTLAAPAARPIAPKSAPLALLVKSPKAGLPDLRAFLTEAGQWSALLRPAELGHTLGTMLGADLLEVDSLREAGVDVEAPLTVSFLQEGTVVCLTMAKGGKALERARATLVGNGKAVKEATQGAQLEGAAAGDKWRAGFAVKGSAICLASGGSDARAALRAATEALAGAGLAGSPAVKAAAGLDAPVMAFFQAAETGGAMEVRASGRALKLVGRATAKQPWLAPVKAAEPLVGTHGEAVFLLRAMLAPRQLSDPNGPAVGTLATLAGNACKGCEAVGRETMEALKPQLSGQVGLAVIGLDPAAALGPLAQYYLAPHVWLAQVKSGAAVRQILDAEVSKLQVQGAQVAKVETPRGEVEWSVRIGPREVRLGVGHDAIYLANDIAALELLWPDPPAERPKAEHAATFSLNGPLATAALRKISVFDVPKSPELGALFAVGVEVGSLLKQAGLISGFADPDGNAVRFEVGFELKPAPPAGPVAK